MIALAAEFANAGRLPTTSLARLSQQGSGAGGWRLHAPSLVLVCPVVLREATQLHTDMATATALASRLDFLVRAAFCHVVAVTYVVAFWSLLCHASQLFGH